MYICFVVVVVVVVVVVLLLKTERYTTWRCVKNSSVKSEQCYYEQPIGIRE